MTFREVSLSLLLLAASCDKTAEESKPEVPAAPIEVAPPAPSGAGAPAGESKAPGQAEPSVSEPKTQVDGIPTEADFEIDAAERISPSNLEAELDRLEREITGE
jgi:hypothetical protein